MPVMVRHVRGSSLSSSSSFLMLVSFFLVGLVSPLLGSHVVVQAFAGDSLFASTSLHPMHLESPSFGVLKGAERWQWAELFTTSDVHVKCSTGNGNHNNNDEGDANDNNAHVKIRACVGHSRAAVETGMDVTKGQIRRVLTALQAALPTTIRIQIATHARWLVDDASTTNKNETIAERPAQCCDADDGACTFQASPYGDVHYAVRMRNVPDVAASTEGGANQPIAKKVTCQWSKVDRISYKNVALAISGFLLVCLAPRLATSQMFRCLTGSVVFTLIVTVAMLFYFSRRTSNMPNSGMLSLFKGFVWLAAVTWGALTQYSVASFLMGRWFSNFPSPTSITSSPSPSITKAAASSSSSSSWGFTNNIFSAADAITSAYAFALNYFHPAYVVLALMIIGYATTFYLDRDIEPDSRSTIIFKFALYAVGWGLVATGVQTADVTIALFVGAVGYWAYTAMASAVPSGFAEAVWENVQSVWTAIMWITLIPWRVLKSVYWLVSSFLKMVKWFKKGSKTEQQQQQQRTGRSSTPSGPGSRLASLSPTGRTPLPTSRGPAGISPLPQMPVDKISPSDAARKMERAAPLPNMPAQQVSPSSAALRMGRRRSSVGTPQPDAAALAFTPPPPEQPEQATAPVVSPLVRQGKIINMKSNKTINLDGPTYQKLKAEGYVEDLVAGTLSPPFAGGGGGGGGRRSSIGSAGAGRSPGPVSPPVSPRGARRGRRG